MKGLLVITGGTKGIGRAIVHKFAQNKFNIITCSRNETDLKNLQSEIHNNYHSELIYYKADLGIKEEVKAFIGFIKDQGTPDVIINNTGIFKPGKIYDEEEGKLEEMMNINLFSAYHLTRGLAKKMMERKKGHIFNICSTASIKAYPDGGSYCITKHAMYGMNNVLREEMKEFNIKVTAVLPGPTFTASWEGVDLPEERFVKPEDVALSVYNNYSLSQSSVVEEILIRPMQGDL